MGFYSTHAGERLQDMLKRTADGCEGERVNLNEEIDLARIMTLQALRMFEATLEKEVSQALQAAVQAHLREAMEHVANLVMQQAKIDAQRKILSQPNTIEFLVDQVARVIFEEVERDNPKLAKKVHDKLLQIRLPGANGKEVENNGTRLDPKKQISVAI